MNRLVIHLPIDHPIPDGEDGSLMVNAYIDELAKTNGLLTWSEVDWDLFPKATDEVSE